MTDASRVYLVDDDESFLNALSRLLRLEGLETRAFVSATALLASITPDSRGCVVADLEMPEMTGFELQERLAASVAPMPVLFLTGHGDIPASVRAMRHGAVDFLEKCAPREALMRSVRTAIERGEREFEKRLRLRELDKRFARLTPREREVLQHVVVGRMNKEIAAALSINERTVKLHRTAITRKVGVHSSAQLATLSTEVGLFGNETA